MEFTRVQIGIGFIKQGNGKNQFQQKGEMEVLVDTGATYSTLPGDQLRSWGISPQREVSLRLADGRLIKRSLGYCGISLSGETIQTPVVFGEEGDPNLLGVIALEDANMTVDPVTKQLLHGTSYIQYSFLSIG